MRAQVIVDNTGTEELSGEWGLSIYIEYNGKKILLDAGASGLFVDNAKSLGIDLSCIDYAVLSHAHYDHANGMEQFFLENAHAPFYVRESCAENCYHVRKLFPEYIGIPRRITKKYADRIVYAAGDYELSEGVRLIGHKTKGLVLIGKREKMYKRKGIRFVPDDFSHEQSLVFETEKGLVIFNSCSHGGAANIIAEVAGSYPGQSVYALIGGFHLYNKSDEEIRAFAEKVKQTGIRRLYTGHCTGGHALGILRDELGACVGEPLGVGLLLEF
ncbi:MAG: MBL fold metallo-hydrolase [bacterium]|nr:MBL fold metallo-hydrolase [bacterium]